MGRSWVDKHIKLCYNRLDEINSDITILGIIPSIDTNREKGGHKKSKNRISFNYFKRRVQHYSQLFFNKSLMKSTESKDTRHLVTFDEFNRQLPERPQHRGADHRSQRA